MSCLSVREIHASFFSRSHSSTSSPFKLVHCDVWISFVLSTSGFRYYLVVLDDFSHLCWTFPLCHMSDVHQRLVESVAYDKTLFGLPIKCFQADNGTEFANPPTRSSLATSPCFAYHALTPPDKTEKAECMLRTINNSICTLLIKAYMPTSYQAEALATST